jgi:hypothetical protein
MTYDLHSFRNAWLVAARGSPSYDADRACHVLVCPALGEAAASADGSMTATATLVVAPDGTLSVTAADGRSLPLSAATNAPVPIPPGDVELYPFLKLPPNWHRAELRGYSGPGVSPEAQAAEQKRADALAALQAQGIVHVHRQIIDAAAAGDTQQLLPLLHITDSAQSHCRPDAPQHGALTAAAKAGHLKVLRDLLDTAVGEPFAANSLAEEADTGSTSANTFNHALGKIGAGRGGKEGPGALAAWPTEMPFDKLHASPYAARNSLAAQMHEILRSPDVAPAVISFLLFENTTFESLVSSTGCYEAAAAGNIATTAVLAEHLQKKGFGLNKLHLDALTCSSGVIQDKFQARSVTKKMTDNFSITPLHFAAINSNSAVLNQFVTTPGVQFETEHKRGRYVPRCLIVSRAKEGVNCFL